MEAAASTLAERSRWMEAMAGPAVGCGILFLIHGLSDAGLLYWNAGLHPRDLGGFWRAWTFPLLHGHWQHLVSNLGPLMVMGTILSRVYPQLAGAFFLRLYAIHGVLAWVLGAPGSTHVGASGLVYGLAAFLFLSGLLRRTRPLMAVSLLIIFLYGGLVWGLLPQEGPVSWTGHLAGALAGLGLAVYYRRQGPQKSYYPWELEEDVETSSEDDPDYYWLQVPTVWPPKSPHKTAVSEPRLRWKYLYRRPPAP